MMQTSERISDKAVFNQMFKSFRCDGMIAHQEFTDSSRNGWGEIKGNEFDTFVFYSERDAKAFNTEGYLTEPLYLSWHGDGERIVEMVDLFGYGVDWSGRKDHKIGIVPTYRN